MNARWPVLLFLPLVFATASAAPVPTPVALGERITFDSRRLGASRELLVAVPESYDRGSKHYPVLIVLDGDAYFLTAVAATRALAASGRAPETIVVAVVSSDREYEFTPPLRATSGLPPGVERAGGADAFIGSLRDEVVPLVDSTYRTRPFRTLVGHSLGGLLAVHALTTAPMLFRGYITIEPSLWWDDRAVTRAALDSLRARPNAIARLVAVEGASVEGWLPQWADLEAVRPAQMRAELVGIAGESHQTIFYRGVYEGLRALFSDFRPALRSDRAYATLPALRAQYAALSRDFGYTVDIPLDALLTIANGDINQRRFSSARHALALADSLYPRSPNVAEFESALAGAERESGGRGPVRPVVGYSAVDPRQAGTLLGLWEKQRSWEALRDQAPDESYVFSLHGDTLFVTNSVSGISGDYRDLPAVVELRGNHLRWDTENRGGGRILTVAELTPDGRIAGRNTLVDGPKMPPGFELPPQTFELTRKPRPKRSSRRRPHHRPIRATPGGGWGGSAHRSATRPTYSAK